MKTSLALVAAAAFLALSAAAPDASALWSYTIPAPAPAPPPARGPSDANCDLGTACYACQLQGTAYRWNHNTRICEIPARAAAGPEVDPADRQGFDEATCRVLNTCPTVLNAGSFYGAQHAPLLQRPGR